MASTHSTQVPRHIAIIMDGNGRWAKQQSLPRLEGHRAGATAVHRIISACIEAGVEYLTLYSFSTENWGRNDDEVSGLMKLFYEALTDHIDFLVKNKVRLRAIGDLERLPSNVQEALQKDLHATEENSKLTLTLAVSYGAREEIVAACKSIVQKVQADELSLEDITCDEFSKSLWTTGLPDPDLLIRSSGEMRISNFLLWQLAYSEILVVPEFWPEFDAEILNRCIAEYASRERRFGKTSEQLVVNSDSSQGLNGCKPASQ